MASTLTPPRPPTRRFLPPSPGVEEPYRLTPRLALRLAILGALVLVVFAVLFLRLWALQVLSGSQYLRTAQDNQLRTVRVQAARGPILDRDGHILVTNRAGTAIEVLPSDLPKKGRYQELQRLSRIVGVPLPQIVREISKRAGDPLTPVIVRSSARNDVVNYLSEHAREFPGIALPLVYLRQYPYQSLAAQVLGYDSQISPTELKASRGSYEPGDVVGQAGVERAFDRYLRGVPGLERLRVDSLGRPRSDLVPSNQPQPGHAVRLTLDLRLQRAAEKALQYGISLARSDGEWAANGGAIVALDPKDGAVLATASAPTYKPSVYVGRVHSSELAAEGLTPATARDHNFPALNRATAVTYPPGSTFKPVTALAAMQEHLVSPYESRPCTGSYTVYRSDGTVAQVFHNWDPNVDQPMTLPTALAASCDTYFYGVGHAFYRLPPERGHPLQKWARTFGFGAPSGLDIGSEAAGTLLTPESLQAMYTAKTDACCWRIDRLWKPGDSIQLAIGQKDLLVTPLQMARFYALVANGGHLVTPYLVQDVEQPGSDGTPSVVLRRFTHPAPTAINVDAGALEAVRQGLWEATHLSLGTSSAIFGSFPISIAGKTGTAEKIIDVPGYHGLKSQSWWCGYGPSDNASLVVCAVIENGGHGGTAAAPAALKVFEAYFGKQATQQGPVYSD